MKLLVRQLFLHPLSLTHAPQHSQPHGGKIQSVSGPRDPILTSSSDCPSRDRRALHSA
jgi:hypothetical protein